MALTLTIAGSTKTLEAASLRLSKPANGIHTATFNVLSTDGSYRPAMDAVVVLTRDATIIHGGLAQKPQETGLFENGALAGIRTRVNTVDYSAYADRRLVNGTMPAGTLKDHLTIIATYLSTFGVTLHASQVDGPDLQELTHVYTKATEVLNDLMKLTAEFGEPYVWRIDTSKVLRAYQPTTNAAPFDILTDSPSQVIGDIEVISDRGHYANSIIVLPASITGEVFDFGLASDAGEIASKGYYEKLIRVENLADAAAAQSRADAELAAALAVHQTVTYRTLLAGLEPGMSQTITVPKRNVNAVGMISEVQIRDYGKDQLISEVTVVIDDTMTNLRRDFRDTIKQWSNVSTGAGVGPTTSGGGGGGGRPGGPVTAIQWNAGNGAFGGESEFTYDAATNCLVAGVDSSITATNPDTCFVYGINCHVADA